MYKRVIILLLNGDICKKYKTDEQIQFQKMRSTLSVYKDDWYFDIGQQIAFISIQFFIIIIFAQVAPIMNFFGSFYFLNKYMIDKYNVCYVYPIEYIGEGRLYTKIKTFAYMCLIMQQMIMFTILCIIFGQGYWKACVAIIGIQAVGILVYECKLHKVLPINWMKKNMSSDFLQDNEIKELTDSLKRKKKEAKNKLNLNNKNV